jgi:hypothetical protein
VNERGQVYEMSGTGTTPDPVTRHRAFIYDLYGGAIGFKRERDGSYRLFVPRAVTRAAAASAPNRRSGWVDHASSPRVTYIEGARRRMTSP